MDIPRLKGSWSFGGRVYARAASPRTAEASSQVIDRLLLGTSLQPGGALPSLCKLPASENCPNWPFLRLIPKETLLRAGKGAKFRQPVPSPLRHALPFPRDLSEQEQLFKSSASSLWRLQYCECNRPNLPKAY